MKRKFKIVADSCCDYPLDRSDRGWIQRVPLNIQVDKTQYVDDESLDGTRFLRHMMASADAPKTACPSPGQYQQAIGTDREEDVYVVTLSGKLSGSYDSAKTGVSLLKEDHPDKNVCVLDSKSAAAGEVALCYKLRALAEQGLSFSEVVEKAKEYIKNFSTYFVLENLDCLRKNGRLTNLQSVITSALRLKLVMGGDDGQIVLRGKCLTTQSALKRMVEMIEKRYRELADKTRPIFITHCNCPERAEQVKQWILERCSAPAAVICRAGGISSVYAGAGGIVVAF